MLRVSGDAATVGAAAGRLMRNAIAYKLSSDATMAAIRAYVATPNGSRAFESLKSNAAAAFPQMVEELRAVAAGAGVAADDVLMLNMQEELGPLAAHAGDSQWQPPAALSHCTDVGLPNPALAGGGLLLGHNEDSGFDDWNRTYWAVASPSDAPAYAAYTYAGQLSSGAFAFNEHGVFFSTNALFPTADTIDWQHGIPRDFVHRHVLAAESVEDALQRACSVRVGSGFSLNLGGFNATEAWNVELSPSGCNKKRVTAAYAHANMYVHTPGVSQYNDTSSLHRMKRAAQLLPDVTGVDGIVEVLGDQEDRTWPIYRDHTPPDGCVTIISALFDSVSGRLTLWANNPKATAPFMTVQWPDELQVLDPRSPSA